MRVDAILIELDGTVVDTFNARRSALEDALRVHGITLSDEEYWEWCAGWPTAGAVGTVVRERALPLDATDQELVALRADRALAQSLAKGSTLTDGSRSALERLGTRHRLAVVSRLQRSDISAILELARLDHLFAFIIGGGDAPAEKPDPAPYAAALQRLGKYRGGLPGSVVALEHGAAGIRSARAAGVTCIAVGPHPAHVALEADAYVSQISALDPTSLATLLDPPRT